MTFVAILLAAHHRAVWQQRRHRAAFWLTVLGLVSAILLSVSLWLLRPGCAGPPRIDTARNDAHGIVMASEQFMAIYHRCPANTRELSAYHFLARPRLDPWLRPYLIECRGAQIRVCSLGPDIWSRANDVCSDDPEQPITGQPSR